MRLSLSILLRLTIIVVVTGIIAFVRFMMKSGPFPSTYFIIWLIASIILVVTTVWSWSRNRKS